MRYIAQVKCLDNAPPELEINVDTIYKRKNIVSSINEDNRTEYTYEEYQYTLNEYLREAVPQNEQSLGEISQLLTVYQMQTDLALAELTAAIGGIK